MKKSRKKEKKLTPTQNENFDKCIEELADMIIEDAKGHHHSELEPFESYAARVRAKIHSNMEEFRGRFAKGYKLLVEELEKNSSENDNLPSNDKIKP